MLFFCAMLLSLENVTKSPVTSESAALTIFSIAKFWIVADVANVALKLFRVRIVALPSTVSAPVADVLPRNLFDAKKRMLLYASAALTAASWRLKSVYVGC